MTGGDLIYLDHNATTPVAPEVARAVAAAVETVWGNPSSEHPPGRAARAALEQARGQVAGLLGCAPAEIVFTSGGTEANNLALLGAARVRRERGRRVVISAVEHPAVEAPAAALEREGFTVTRVPVGADGRVEAAAFMAALTPDTAVASLMHANNETGALQPVAQVAAAARRLGIPLHTDAAQSAGKIPVQVEALGVDLLTVAGHKLYAPKGVGALYVRAGTELAPVLFGAPQEGGRRPGTENLPGIAGLGVACSLAAAEITQRERHARELTARLWTALAAAVPGLELNGPADPDRRLPNTLNVSVPRVPAPELVAALPGVALSAGAACHSGATTPSAVLLAMGIDPQRAACAVRMSTGRDNTPGQMDAAAAAIGEAARRLGARR